MPKPDGQKEDLGIAVTFSVSKDMYESYQEIFNSVVASLRVFQQRKDTGANANLGTGPGDIGETTFIPDGDKVDISAQKTQERKGSGGDSDLMILGLVVAAAVGIVIAKKKGGKK
jgi:hypothetical protein